MKALVEIIKAKPPGQCKRHRRATEGASTQAAVVCIEDMGSLSAGSFPQDFRLAIRGNSRQKVSLFGVTQVYDTSSKSLGIVDETQ
jgi:hypothetical protein